MINKQDVFAQSGQQTQDYSATDYATGMIPNTIAMAEDVNSFGNMLDTEFRHVCKEIANVVTNGVINASGSQGATLVENNDAQLLTQLRRMSNGFTQTGIRALGTTSAPTQNGVTQIVFPTDLYIYFNTGGYFGGDASSVEIGKISANTTWTITNSEPAGVRYFVATLSGGAITLSTQTDAPLGYQGNTKCLLGSFFVISNNGTMQIQSGSWCFQPWLQTTPAIVREAPTAQTKGGMLYPSSGAKLKIGPLDIKDEGINFASGHFQNPDVLKAISAAQDFSYKFLYPGYNPSASATTTIDTTHIYNITNASWDNIGTTQAGKYMVLVPCIIPTGQTCMIPAMSEYNVSTGYNQLFATIDEAAAAIYSLKYNDDSTYRNRKRAIYLGYSIIVKVGATDLTDSENFAVVGMISQELDGFTSAGGQTGGGTGVYVPMESKIISAASFTADTNTKYVVQGRTAQIPITLGTPKQNVRNEIVIEYTHNSAYGGIALFDGTRSGAAVNWWGINSSLPSTLTNGYTYLITCEYVNSNWRASWITTDATTTLLSRLYPVGSIYLGTQNTCPLSTLIPGSTWSLVSSGRALWTGTGSNGNSTIEAGLPNITGAASGIGSGVTHTYSGALKQNAMDAGTFTAGTGGNHITLGFDASGSNNIYGKSSTVQPPAYVVNVWRRTA